MSERLASLLSLLAGLAVLVLFPLPFWLGLGVLHWQAPWQVALVAGAGLAIALLAVFAVVRTRQALLGQPLRQARVDLAALKAQDLAQLQANPGLHRWLPLARRLSRFELRTAQRYEQRYGELLAHPLRAAYAARLLQGDWVGDAEIEYLEQPQRLVTCEHLQPIERDLRRHGIRAFPAPAPGHLWSAAWLAIAPLRARYLLADSVVEVHSEDHPHDPGRVSIECRACHSGIESGGSVVLPP